MSSKKNSTERLDHPSYDLQSQDLYDNPQEDIKLKFRVVRLPPFTYMHVLNKNTNVTRVECGPLQYTCLDHERVIFGPTKMVILAPRTYCVVENPVLRNEQNEIVFDAHKQVKLRLGDREVRFSDGDRAAEPFPFFPGEKLLVPPTPLQVVEEGTALRLRALRDFVDLREACKEKERGGVKRKAGEEWLFRGPGTYIPAAQEEVMELVKSTQLDSNKALRLLARKNFIDRRGEERKAGDEWLVTGEGSYLPDVDEIVVTVIQAQILTDKVGLHVRALRSFVDNKGRERKAGEEWLVTNKDTEAYIPDVNEKIIQVVPLVTLNNKQYCIIQDPVDEDGKQNFGGNRIVKGSANFFLKPGESLPGSIKDIIVLGEDEGMILKNMATFVDSNGRKRAAGQKWTLYGPCEFIPPVEVQIVERRRAVVQVEALGLYLFSNHIFVLLVVFIAIIVGLILSRWGGRST